MQASKMIGRKSTHLLALLLGVASVIGGCAKSLHEAELPGFDAASPAVFPADTWMRYESPEAAGWSSEKLASAEKLSNRAGSAAVVIIYNGAVLAQWGETSRRFMCHSVRKSLLSALYGIAVDDGLVHLDETVGSIGIDDVSPLSDSEKSAKVSDLLKSRSGIYHPAAYETRAMKESRPARGSHAPGTRWYYNNWDFNALATIYNQKTSADLFEAFEAQLAVPLQMQDFELRHTYYHLEAENSRHPAYPFRMSARDLARIGLLYLNQGRWRKDQIIPSEWIDDSVRPHSTYSSGGYGYMWWTVTENSLLGQLGAYAAFGYGGQAIYVVPGANLVFVHRADTYKGRRSHVNGTAMRNILMAVLKARIGPAQSDPGLVAIDEPESETPDLNLSSAQTAGLIGRYSRNGFTASVRETDGRLEITSPRWGNYFLNPVTATKFEAEDARTPLEFETDASGMATTLRIYFRRNDPYVMTRAQ